ncbi:unnamed protein product [Rangifer tarandus platyrhynchus]|uniref:Uncharacterized protein n=1 Tax=Rangifer tarandus platyrhynchus TaxID=3082113 RepID=A0AC59YJS2_RANTA
MRKVLLGPCSEASAETWRFLLPTWGPAERAKCAPNGSPRSPPPVSPPPSQTSSPVGHEPTFRAVKSPVRPSSEAPQGSVGRWPPPQRL